MAVWIDVLIESFRYRYLEKLGVGPEKLLERNPRLVVVRGAGHLAFSDLCTLGADRGGALAIADVERRITFTYAMNQCQSGRNALNGVYYKAFYDSLGS